jgi:hypothetical protein
VLHALGRGLVYGPLRDNLGMSHVRLAYTAGEAIGPELFEFYRALGVNMKQLYGMTESSALICIQQDGEVRLDTVGTPLTGVEVRIGDSGEVLYRSPGVFVGYYKNPDATRQTIEDGWVHSGDAGIIDKDGHLRIIDRARDVGHLTDGTLFAPKYLENKLKFSPYIREAVCLGQDRPFVAALLNIDITAVGSWAERCGLAYTSYTDLSQKPEVYELVREEIARMNRSLLEEPRLRGAQVRRFLMLHKELDPDDQEITRTRKVRRASSPRVRDARGGAVLGAGPRLGGGESHLQDGRTGTCAPTCRSGRPRCMWAGRRRERPTGRADAASASPRGRVDDGADEQPIQRAAPPRGRQHQRPVRRGARAHPGEPRRAPGRDRGHHRAERGGEDDAPQRRQRLLPPPGRTDPLQGRDRTHLRAPDVAALGLARGVFRTSRSSAA